MEAHTDTTGSSQVLFGRELRRASTQVYISPETFSWRSNSSPVPAQNGYDEHIQNRIWQTGQLQGIPNVKNRLRSELTCGRPSSSHAHTPGHPRLARFVECHGRGCIPEPYGHVNPQHRIYDAGSPNECVQRASASEY